MKLLTNYSLYVVYMSLICYGRRILTLCSARRKGKERETERDREKKRETERHTQTDRERNRQTETERRRRKGWIEGRRAPTLVAGSINSTPFLFSPMSNTSGYFGSVVCCTNNTPTQLVKRIR